MCSLLHFVSNSLKNMMMIQNCRKGKMQPNENTTCNNAKIENCWTTNETDGNVFLHLFKK